ncbi:MAG TPA: hypothetical protein VN222_10640, partial [Novosphingobium sp.]|nr:hypothetical protein [Novosphingobium sp.]
MPGLALKLLGVWSWIRSAGAAALKWAFASATHLLLVALALALGWGVWERRQARHWQANAVKLFAGWKADRERAAAAQAAWLAKLKENADGAEQAHSDMDRGSGDRLAAYAAAHRLPAGPADGSAVPAQGASAGIPGLP